VLPLLLLSAALADEPDGPLRPWPPSGPTAVVMVNPIGPLVAMGVNLAPLDLGISVSAFDLNVRTHHVFSARWALTTQADWTRGELLVQGTHAGLRIGPRLSLGQRGLIGWGLSPFLLTGYTSLSAGEYELAGWATLGAGVEIGRVFVRNHFAAELGMGLYGSGNLAYSPHAETLADSELPSPVLPVKPLFTASVGYAF